MLKVDEIFVRDLRTGKCEMKTSSNNIKQMSRLCRLQLFFSRRKTHTSDEPQSVADDKHLLSIPINSVNERRCLKFFWITRQGKMIVKNNIFERNLS